MNITTLLTREINNNLSDTSNAFISLPLGNAIVFNSGANNFKWWVSVDLINKKIVLEEEYNSFNIDNSTIVRLKYNNLADILKFINSRINTGFDDNGNQQRNYYLHS